MYGSRLFASGNCGRRIGIQSADCRSTAFERSRAASDQDFLTIDGILPDRFKERSGDVSVATHSPDLNVQRHALLVLGMHRSGTSALTNLLVHLGAAPPKTLMGPNQNNPLGFWESQSLCALHDRLLNAAGSSWDAWTALDAAAFERAAAQEPAD